MLSIRQMLTTAALLVSFMPAAFAQPPWGWQNPPPVAEVPDGPALGVLVDNIPFDKLDSLGLSYGVEVARAIPGSPADGAGLKGGDILMAVDGQPVYSVARLRWLVARAAPDTALDIKYSRDGATSTVKITPRTAQAEPEPMPYRETPSGPSPSGYMGVQLQPLTAGLRQAFDIPEDTGALVAGVDDGSPADSAGVQAGDVIVKMDRRTIHGIDDVLRVLDYFGPGESVKVDIIRDKQTRTLTVDLGEAPKGKGSCARHPQWHHPGFESMPFFADPDWWQDMQQYMKRWQHFRDRTSDAPGSGGSL